MANILELIKHSRHYISTYIYIYRLTDPESFPTAFTQRIDVYFRYWTCDVKAFILIISAFYSIDQCYDVWDF